MKNETLILIALFMFAFTIMGCENTNSGERDYSCDPVVVWVYKNKNDICNLFFYKTSDNESIVYTITYYNLDILIANIEEVFKISENTKPFSEWNECNIKFPIDTTKSWFFRFQGKNTPKNILFLYDTRNNIGDTLIFWDSVSNIKYYFEKIIMELP